MQQYLKQPMEFLKDEEGATAAEYALLASLIAAAIALTVTAIGISVNSLFRTVLSAF